LSGDVAKEPHPNELMAFYVRLASSEPTAADELRLRENIERYIGALGGRINEQDDWSSYDAWLYFKHVGVEEFCQRYFDRWEEAQGKNRTFFVEVSLTLTMLKGSCVTAAILLNNISLEEPGVKE